MADIDSLTGDALTSLRHKNPWPDVKPVIDTDYVSKGWLTFHTRVMLGRHISEDAKIIVELGTWRGMSTRFIADCAPNAIVIAVDHWEGSDEHRENVTQNEKMTGLMDMFFHDTWEYRARVIPLKARSVDGLKLIAELGISPDLIYIDADHSYEGAYADITSAHRIFPKATLIGDDFDWPGVRQAAVQAAHENDAGIEYLGGPVAAAWRFVKNKSSEFAPTGI